LGNIGIHEGYAGNEHAEPKEANAHFSGITSTAWLPRTGVVTITASKRR
jgi:hypothetical protein